MLREARVTHVAPERLGPWSLGAKATSFSIAAPALTQVACTVLRVCPFIPPMSLMACRRLSAFVQRWDGACSGEDEVPTMGCSVAIHCRLALEQPRFKTETSTHHWSELFACYSATMPRMSVN
jgi:hypothetical protein